MIDGLTQFKHLDTQVLTVLDRFVEVGCAYIS